MLPLFARCFDRTIRRKKAFQGNSITICRASSKSTKRGGFLTAHSEEDELTVCKEDISNDESSISPTSITTSQVYLDERSTITPGKDNDNDEVSILSIKNDVEFYIFIWKQNKQKEKRKATNCHPSTKSWRPILHPPPITAITTAKEVIAIIPPDDNSSHDMCNESIFYLCYWLHLELLHLVRICI